MKETITSLAYLRVIIAVIYNNNLDIDLLTIVRYQKRHLHLRQDYISIFVCTGLREVHRGPKHTKTYILFASFKEKIDFRRLNHFQITNQA